ncbi:MAG: M23 family metallopeptidase [Arthrobacter sp.]|nr:M23 family metallopeptidase [Arthrobacter sp.]
MKVFPLLTVLLVLVPVAVPVPVRVTVPTPVPARGAGAPPPSSPAGGWSWPLSPRPAVLRGFDPPDRPWLSGHRGVDLRAAHDGAPVTSPAPGRVSFAGFVVDRPVLTVDHGDGLRSSFEPVDSALRAGDEVGEGSVLGRALPGHCGATPCVHWGVRRGEEYLNPLAFVMDLRPSILLPPVNPGSGQGGSG